MTITLDEKLLRQARIKAAEQDKSLSRYVADLVEGSIRHSAEYEAARQRFLSVKPVRLREPGEKLPTRDEIYDRKIFRR